MKGPPLGPGGEDITWPNQVAPPSRMASSTRKIKPQTSNHLCPASKSVASLSWSKRRRHFRQGLDGCYHPS